MNPTPDNADRLLDCDTLGQMEIFRFRGKTGVPATCGITIEQDGDRVTVTLTELSDNPGMSVTNQVDHIATLIYRERLSGYDPARIEWIEHYQETTRPTEHSKNTKCQTWDRVTLQFNGKQFHSPQWKYWKIEPIQTPTK